MIRIASCSWLVLLACGGISERGRSDEGGSGSASGGAASGGAASKPSRGGSPPASHAGTLSVAGTVTSVAGTATMTMPTPAIEPGPCFNDTDCPVSSCGGEVCNWTKVHEQPLLDKPYVCNPAGTDPKGEDGWCTTDANCKCLALGAKCVGVRCTFTRAEDAPGR